MMIKELSKPEFRATFVMPMHRMGEEESYRLIPLKNYLADCIYELSLPTTIEDIEIQHVYLNGDKTFTHVMFFFGKPNVYLVIVIDHGNDSVHGHHILDLNEEYGLRRKQ
jgi:hypothetical protein